MKWWEGLKRWEGGSSGSPVSMKAGSAYHLKFGPEPVGHVYSPKLEARTLPPVNCRQRLSSGPSPVDMSQPMGRDWVLEGLEDWRAWSRSALGSGEGARNRRRRVKSDLVLFWRTSRCGEKHCSRNYVDYLLCLPRYGVLRTYISIYIHTRYWLISGVLKFAVYKYIRLCVK